MPHRNIRTISVRGGFTLIEIIIAILIISFGLIALIGYFAGSVALSTHNESYQTVSIIERGALDHIEILHRTKDGITLLYDPADLTMARENYFFYANPLGGQLPGYYCCYTVQPYDPPGTHPELQPVVNGQILTRGMAIVTMRFISESGDPLDQLSQRNKPNWDDAIPAGKQIGPIRIAWLTVR